MISQYLCTLKVSSKIWIQPGPITFNVEKALAIFDTLMLCVGPLMSVPLGHICQIRCTSMGFLPHSNGISN